MQRYEIVTLAGIVLLGLVLRQHYFSGTFCNDDLRHAYHGYFLFDSPAEKYADVSYKNGTDFYRMGVNLPVWIATHLFGVHDWSLVLAPMIASLAGIVFIYLLLRMIADVAAAMLGAAIWACLPIDVYMATVLLQDNLFVSLLALFLLLIVAAERNDRTRQAVLLLAAGFVLGYLQYVKENAIVILCLVGLWAFCRCIITRRVQWRWASILLGFLAAQALFGLLFWTISGEFLLYSGHFSKALSGPTIAERYPPVKMLLLYSKMLFQGWQFGYIILVFPIAAALALLSRETKYRLLIALLTVAQLYIIYVPSKYTPTSRYLLQVSVPFILLTALGLAWILKRFSPGWRKVLTPLAVIAVALVTAWPLDRRYQEYGAHRGEGHRRIFRYLTTHADENDKVYVDTIYGTYTQRAFYQFNDFRRLLGGFGPLREAHETDSGWVVLSSLEIRWRGHPYEIPDNWLEVDRYETSLDKRHRWTSLYMILPKRDTRDLVPVFPSDGGLKLTSFCLPDTSRYEFAPLDFRRPLAQYRWADSRTPVTLERTREGLGCTVGGNPDQAARQTGGLVFSVPNLQALRFTAGFENPENIESILVEGRNAMGRSVSSWSWKTGDGATPRSEPTTYTFIPGRRNGPFTPSGETNGDAVREIGVFLRVTPTGQAGLILHDAAAAATAGPTPDVSAYSFVPVEFAQPPEHYRLPAGDEQMRITSAEDGLACTIVGEPEAEAPLTAGIQFAVPGLDALRLQVSFQQAGNIEAVYVETYATPRSRIAGWLWKANDLDHLSREPHTLVFLPGQSTGFFDFFRKRDNRRTRYVRVSLRATPGTTAGLTLHRAEVAAPPTPTPDVSALRFLPVSVEKSEQSWESHWSRSAASVEVQPGRNGLQCRIESGADTSRGQYGGVKVPVPPFDALRFEISCDAPENITALYVFGYDSRRNDLVKWVYHFTDAERPDTTPMTFTLVPGQDSGPFETVDAADLRNISTVHIFARVRPNSVTGFTLHNLELAPTSATISDDQSAVP